MIAAEPLYVVPELNEMPVPAVKALATEPAEPVVFWLSVGTSAAWIVDMTTFVPLPRKYEPLVVAPANAFMAVCAVVWPEPPLAIGSVPVTPVDSGKPVVFVSVPLDGVPRAPPGAT